MTLRDAPVQGLWNDRMSCQWTLVVTADACVQFSNQVRIVVRRRFGFGGLP